MLHNEGVGLLQDFAQFIAYRSLTQFCTNADQSSTQLWTKADRSFSNFCIAWRSEFYCVLQYQVPWKQAEFDSHLQSDLHYLEVGLWKSCALSSRTWRSSALRWSRTLWGFHILVRSAFNQILHCWIGTWLSSTFSPLALTDYEEDLTFWKQKFTPCSTISHLQSNNDELWCLEILIDHSPYFALVPKSLSCSTLIQKCNTPKTWQL